MPIDPQVIAHYEAKKSATQGAAQAPSIEEIRRNADAIYNDKAQFPPVHKVINTTVPCFWGEMPVRIYLPADQNSAPVLIYYHGGGFMMHNIASHDSLCRKLSLESGAIVVNVGYRLAPEAKWPAWYEDGYAALEWVSNNIRDYGGDPEKICVGGDSAGAIISAAVAMMARDRRGPKVRLQILAYGTGCGLTEEESASMRELLDHNYVLSRDFMKVTEKLSSSTQETIYDHPGKAADLRHMPKTFSLNAEYDPLRDDGEEYARRLQAAGNEVISWRVPGMMHGFLLLWDKFDTSAFAVSEIGRVIRETFSS